ncbi:MAG: crossover junction endodeoxyribonuclease RuvC [Myxococcota bacterium]
MLILGLDLSLTCGWCLFRDGSVESCGVHRIRGENEGRAAEVRWRRRCSRLENWSEWLVDLREHLHGCGAIVFEAPGYVQMKSRSHLESFGDLSGVLALELGDIAPMHTVAPATVKKAIAGHGHATKDLVRARVNRAFDLDLHADDHDTSDAVAVAWTHYIQRQAT